MRKIHLTLAIAFVFGFATAFVVPPEARAHGAACGQTCVDADGGGAADDLAECIEEMDSDPSDGICGCVRLPGQFPEGGEPVYDAAGENHLNALSISGFANEGGPNGCVDVNGESGIYGSDGSTDLESCHETAGQACYDNGCATITIDAAACGGDQDCSDPNDPLDADGEPCEDETP